MAEDPECSARAQPAQRDGGLGIAIDDRGHGDSTFSEARRCPATELEIDQASVGTFAAGERARRLVGSMITLAQRHGIRAARNGAWDDATARRPLEPGRDREQGFHLGRSMPGLDPLGTPDEGMTWRSPRRACSPRNAKPRRCRGFGKPA